MDQYKKWYRFHILDCQDQYVRDSFAELLAVLLKTVAVHEYDIMAKERCASLPCSVLSLSTLPSVIVANRLSSADAGRRQERMAQIELSGFPAPEAEPQYTYISQTLNVRFMEYHISMVRYHPQTIATYASPLTLVLYFVMQSEATRPAWRRFHQYFWLIKEYGHAGHEEVRILVFFSRGQ
jgi:hypothetical protein